MKVTSLILSFLLVTVLVMPSVQAVPVRKLNYLVCLFVCVCVRLFAILIFINLVINLVIIHHSTVTYIAFVDGIGVAGATWRQ